MKFLRVDEVADIFSVSTSTIWRWVSCGDFPKPTKLASRTTAWSLKSIEEFAKSKEAAANEF